MANRISFGIDPRKYMEKATYDPNEDGIIAVAQTEADMCKETYDPNDDGIIALENLEKIYDYEISNDVLHAHDEEKTMSTSDAWVKAKEITINSLVRSPLLLRTYFELKSYSSSYTVYARIYKNGSAYGTERSTTSTSYVSFTEDLEFSEGDTIELWVYNPNCYAYVQNFRVLGKVILRGTRQSEVFAGENTV